MKVCFFTPPPAQRAGGLDAAIESLRAALTAGGVEVADQLSPDADLVHFHGLWQPRHAALARECRARGVPYLVSPHGMLEPWAWRHKWWKKWPYFWLAERRYLAHATALLATAAAEAARLRCFFPRQRIESLPLGLTGAAQPDPAAARARLGWREEERVLLFLSRIHVKKGLDLLLRALAELNPANTRLVIVGGGDPAYVRSLQAFAAKHRATLPPVDWIGEVWGEARWSYFQGADLFCLPTHSENFGLAVLEALQVGTPALTTRATPWADELGEGRGFIGEPRVESIRALLARFLAEPPRTGEHRDTIARWTRTRFSWPALTPRYVMLYESLRGSVRSLALPPD